LPRRRWGPDRTLFAQDLADTLPADAENLADRTHCRSLLAGSDDLLAKPYTGVLEIVFGAAVLLGGLGQLRMVTHDAASSLVGFPDGVELRRIRACIRITTLPPRTALIGRVGDIGIREQLLATFFFLIENGLDPQRAHTNRPCNVCQRGACLLRGDESDAGLAPCIEQFGLGGTRTIDQVFQASQFM
jgi:hypothetical protein